ncbi:MAG: hypothetical protein QOI08_727 [Actinomycetota bacterium]|nr:hypothetical protein [Actinomycetota bacterium]
MVRRVTPTLVGRTDELAVLERAFERLSETGPAAVLVAGEAGVGKSRVVEEAVIRFAAQGAGVLSGSCVQLVGEAIAFAPLAGALRELVQMTDAATLDAYLGVARDDLGRLVPELLTAGSTATSDATSTSRMFEMLLGVFERAAADRSLVLVIEDLHWADRSTLDFLLFLLRTLRAARVLVVATYRSDELDRQHPLRAVLGELERQRAIETIALRRFDRDEVGAQLESMLSARPDRSFVEEVFDRSGGNAFLVEELASTQSLTDGAGGGGGLAGLRNVLLARVERLEPRTQQLLRVMATAGNQVSHRLVAAVAGLDDLDLDDALRDAVEHHVLMVDEGGQGYNFRHDLVRSAIYDEVLPGTRVRLHTAYADALERDRTLGKNAAVVASAIALHRYAAHDLPRALVGAIDATHEASRSYAHAEALGHLERALEIWGAVPDASALTGIDEMAVMELAVDEAFRAGEVHRGVMLVDQALDQIDEQREPARAALLHERRARLLRVAMQEGMVQEAERGVALVPEPSPERALLLGTLAQCLFIEHGFGGFESRRVAEEAVEVARAVDSPSLLVSPLISLGTVLTFVGEHDRGIASLQEALALATELHDDEGRMRSTVNLSDAYDALGRLEEAIAAARDGIATARAVGLASMFGALLATNLGESLVKIGEWDEAQQELEGALGYAASGLAEIWVRSSLAELAIARGSFDVAREHIEVVRTQAAHLEPTQDAILLAQIRTQLAHAEGHLDVAGALVSEALESVAEQEVPSRYAMTLVCAGLAVEADVAEQARERSQEVGPDNRARQASLSRAVDAMPVDRNDERAHRALARAELARVNGVSTAEAWRATVDAWRLARDARFLAYSLYRLAQMQIAEGDREPAAASLTEAHGFASQLRAKPLQHDIEALARRARIDMAGTTRKSAGDGVGALGLTDREMQVLRHLAAGRSNAEIATALFISPKTASVHVSNIFTKIGVRNRTEAAAIAHELGVESDD